MKLKQLVPIICLILGALIGALGVHAQAQVTDTMSTASVPDELAELLKSYNGVSTNFVRVECDKQGHVTKVVDTNIAFMLQGRFKGRAKSWSFPPYIVNGQAVACIREVRRTYGWQISAATIEVVGIKN
jgi:hypothetical protein